MREITHTTIQLHKSNNVFIIIIKLQYNIMRN